MNYKLLCLSMAPMAVVAQFDIAGYVSGPEGRNVAANLISALLINLFNAILGVVFGTAA